MAAELIDDKRMLEGEIEALEKLEARDTEAPVEDTPPEHELPDKYRGKVGGKPIH